MNKQTQNYSGKDLRLCWQVDEKHEIMKTPVFTINSQHETASNGIEGNYISLTAPDWVMVIPVIDNDFILVRQWRHSLRALTTEFPGGVANAGENMLLTAARELEEETGFRAGEMKLLGSVNPNPALFENTIHIVLATKLEQTGELHLDNDELIDIYRLPITEVIKNFGNKEYQHGLMGTALAFYMQQCILR